MLKTITVAENPFDPSSWTQDTTRDVCAFLVDRFPTWPSTARVYLERVSHERDVTPVDEHSVRALQEMDGPFIVVVYPAEPATIIAIVAVVAAIAAAYFFRPEIPTVAVRNSENPSPNNELSARENKPRIRGRIPDIFGTVRSTPDLIAVPYKTYIGNQEVEHAFMCVGRGLYDVSDIRDGDTPIESFSGASVEVYNAFTSPNYGSPSLVIGVPDTDPLYEARRIDLVNGQVLRPPNKGEGYYGTSFAGDGKPTMYFSAPNKISVSTPQTYVDFRKLFTAGDQLTLVAVKKPTVWSSSTANIQLMINYNGLTGRLIWPSAHGISPTLVGGPIIIQDFPISGYTGDDFNFRGQFVTTAIGSTTIDFENPGLVNQDYKVYANKYNPGFSTSGVYNAHVLSHAGTTQVFYPVSLTGMVDLDGVYTVASVDESEILITDPTAPWAGLGTNNAIGGFLTSLGAKYVGPFVIDNPSRVFCNFVAQNGLYRDDGSTQTAIDVTVAVETLQMDANGDPLPLAVWEPSYVLLQGSSKDRTLVGQTSWDINTYTCAKLGIRVTRISFTDLESPGQIVDEIRWKDCYSMKEVTLLDFGDVTTIRSTTYATPGALSIRARKLNLLASRRIQSITPAGMVESSLAASSRFCDIMFHVSVDPRIGRRTLDELDLQSFLDAYNSAVSCFGHAAAGEFNYTFDAANLSYEETVAMIASVAFCQAYRRGSTIRLSFEKATPDSTVLFNHRNKIPGTEARTVRFGIQDDCDGVEFDYVDPTDDSLATVYIPADLSAVNPKRVESAGIRSKLQAYFHAWRTWNKLRYQNTSVEFEATQEADVLLLRDRILNADNTRPETMDGDVLSQNVLELELSQPVDLSVGTFTIFLQLSDGTVESMPVTQGSGPHFVLLDHAPGLTLVVGSETFARTTFTIVKDGSVTGQAFLVTEKDPRSNFTSVVRAVNYDDRYYSNDDDYLTGIIDANGNPV